MPWGLTSNGGEAGSHDDPASPPLEVRPHGIQRPLSGTRRRAANDALPAGARWHGAGGLVRGGLGELHDRRGPAAGRARASARELSGGPARGVPVARLDRSAQQTLPPRAARARRSNRTLVGVRSPLLGQRRRSLRARPAPTA